MSLEAGAPERGQICAIRVVLASRRQHWREEVYGIKEHRLMRVHAPRPDREEVDDANDGHDFFPALPNHAYARIASPDHPLLRMDDETRLLPGLDRIADGDALRDFNLLGIDENVVYGDVLVGLILAVDVNLVWVCGVEGDLGERRAHFSSFASQRSSPPPRTDIRMAASLTVPRRETVDVGDGVRLHGIRQGTVPLKGT